MAVFFNEPMPDTKWNDSANAWLDELVAHKAPDNSEYWIRTGDGNESPVGYISLLQNKRGEFAVLISYDEMSSR